MNAKVSGNWRALLEFYTVAFDSFDNLNSVFKVKIYLFFKNLLNTHPLHNKIYWNNVKQINFYQRDPSKEYKTIEDPGLKFEFINLVFDIFSNTVSQFLFSILLSIYIMSLRYCNHICYLKLLMLHVYFVTH